MVLFLPATMFIARSTQLLCSGESSIHFNEGRASSPSRHLAFKVFPISQKRQSELLNSLGRWPTLVLLVSMLRITTTTANLSS